MIISLNDVKDLSYQFFMYASGERERIFVEFEGGLHIITIGNTKYAIFDIVGVRGNWIDVTILNLNKNEKETTTLCLYNEIPVTVRDAMAELL